MVEIELAIVGEANSLKASIFLFDQKLPWHEVGVVIHRRHDDQIALLDVAAPPRLRDEVDRLGRIPNEDDLARRFAVDEVGHHVSSRLVLRRRSLGQVIDAAMDVGVRLPVIAVDGGDDLLGFLRAGRAIEKRQSLFALVPGRENREIVPYSCPIDCIVSRGRDHVGTSSDTDLARDCRFQEALDLFDRHPVDNRPEKSLNDQVLRFGSG